MKTVCDNCGAVYRIPEEKLTRETHKATCRRCGHRMVIRKAPAAGSLETVPPAPILPPPGPGRTLPGTVAPRAAALVHDPSGDLTVVLVACVLAAAGAMILAIRPADQVVFSVAGLLLALWSALTAILVVGSGHMGRRPASIRTSVLSALVLAGLVTAVLNVPLGRILDRSGRPTDPVASTRAPAAAGTTAPAPTHMVPASVIAIQLRNDASVKACFLEHERLTGEIPSVTLRFTLAPSGSATAASLEEAAYQGSALENCLAASVQRITFPPFDGDPFPFSYPFRF